MHVNDIANFFLSVSWVATVAFILLHIQLRWNATRYGVLTMTTTIAFGMMLTWINLKPWFGVQVLEHPWLRFGFWAAMSLFFIHRLVLLILAQKAGRVYEDSGVGFRDRHEADEDQVKRPEVDGNSD